MSSSEVKFRSMAIARRGGGVVNSRMRIPVEGPGAVTFLGSEWPPGKHAPRDPIEMRCTRRGR